METNTFLEALKRALARGESLEQAKQSLMNAGYDEMKIESAARMLNSPVQRREPKVIQKSTWFKKRPEKPKIGNAPNIVSNYDQIQNKPIKQPVEKTTQTQKTSYYGDKPKKDWVLIMMIIIFLLLLGILVTIFFFKPQLIKLFG